MKKQDNHKKLRNLLDQVSDVMRFSFRPALSHILAGEYIGLEEIDDGI